MSVDLGFDTHTKLTIRWAGINAPEKSTPQGVAALESLRVVLPEGSTCTLETIKGKKEKFGRYLGTFFDEDGVNINEWLVENGHAQPYKV